MTVALYGDKLTFMIISHSVILRMRNILERHFRENQNTYFMSSNFFFENRAVYEIM